MGIRSMTGFGRVSGETALGSLTVEIKSVNHRYLDISLRLPRDVASFEEDIKATIRERVSRGRIEASIRLQSAGDKAVGVEFNHAEVKAYVTKLEALSHEIGVSFEVRLEHLLSLPGVLVETPKAIDDDEVNEQIKGLMHSALAALLLSRETEGERLSQDLAERLGLISSLVESIFSRGDASVEAYRKRLQENVARILPGLAADSNRIETEVVLFAEKSSIAEEVVRLRTHIAGFQQFLSSKDAVGRKMDFYVQEMNREVNTIGSKSADVVISQLVVEIKSELEKIREQVQNIE